LEKFRNESAISTWIYRIAVNTCLSYLRSEKNKPKDALSDFILETKSEEVSEKNQQVALLYKCISQLEENDRMIITMVLDEVEYPTLHKCLVFPKAICVLKYTVSNKG
jgi:RNA polymerase sigma factor (sigma-70 family)